MSPFLILPQRVKTPAVAIPLTAQKHFHSEVLYVDNQVDFVYDKSLTRVGFILLDMCEFDEEEKGQLGLGAECYSSLPLKSCHLEE